MKDAHDNRTAPLLPEPKRRGRPTTGKGMTAAERKQKQRNAWKTTPVSQWTVTTCVHVLGLKGFAPDTYKRAFEQLMYLRGHGLGGWFI